MISIHAPREGSDLGIYGDMEELAAFLSTLPARGATYQIGRGFLDGIISIHAPREGSDSPA